MIQDILGELIIKRLIVRFFGYSTLLIFYKVLRNEEKVKWLNDIRNNEGEEMGKNIQIIIAGIISFTLTFMCIGFIVNYFIYN